MGNLHRGHLSLVIKSQEENDITVVSIFVNPKQFNDDSDYNNYPRTEKADLDALKAQGVDYCFIPNAEELYPDSDAYEVSEQVMSGADEGAFRPGHFTGVLTVVLKFFLLIKPQNAYFGEKDYQQFQLVKGMVKAFFLDICVCACPTLREESKLALSSRNNRLTKEQKKKAERFAEIFHSNESIEAIQRQLRAERITYDYILERGGRRFAAVYIDNIRLIDNYTQSTWKCEL